MTLSRTLLASLLAASLAGSVSAAQLLPASPDDLVATRVVALAAPGGAVERKPVSFGWALDPSAAVVAPAAFVGESREWFAQVDAAQLRRGLTIDTTAPGAVVRLSPLGKSAHVAPAALELSRGGRTIDAAQAYSHRSDATALQAAGFDPGAGSMVAQISPALGDGRFEIRHAQAQGRYLLQVFEPNSKTVLRSGATRPVVHAGGRVDVEARFEAASRALPGTQFGGQLVSPSGRLVDLAFVAGGDGRVRAQALLPADAAVEPGLWEAQVFAEGQDRGLRVQREGRTAFAVAQPTARFAGEVRTSGRGTGYAFPVQVGSPGRYEVAGTLFATGEDGIARPVAQAAAAAWLEPGARTLRLAFDPRHVPLGYGAPYELRELTLKDQARMGLLERRELAARVRGTEQVAVRSDRR
jgi:hypothetical protein